MVSTVSIVALGRTREVPRFGEDGAVERHAVMPVSWGADHRVVDGATLARFTNTWKRYLEAPEELLVRGR